MGFYYRLFVGICQNHAPENTPVGPDVSGGRGLLALVLSTHEAFMFFTPKY